MTKTVTFLFVKLTQLALQETTRNTQGPHIPLPVRNLKADLCISTTKHW